VASGPVVTAAGFAIVEPASSRENRVDLVLVISLAVHTLSMVIVLGYYGILGRIVLPALRRSLDGPGVARSLVGIEHRARPFLVLSIAAFAITGIYLTFADEQYEGLVALGGSSWTTLILLKHLVVAGVVGLGLLLDRLIEGLAGWEAEPPETSVRTIGLLAEGITALGAIVILLTAAAQLSPG
jgi:uncharacterized membrane protein